LRREVNGKHPMSHYRNKQPALEDRRRLLAERVAAIESEIDRQTVSALTSKQQKELAALRRKLTPADDSVAALAAAEQAADRGRAWLADALDIAASLDDHVVPVLPDRYALARWTVYLVVGAMVLVGFILALLRALTALS
jgi:hypothetical protein